MRPPVFMHTDDCDQYRGRVDVYLQDGDTIDLDGETIRVIHTPGHTRGGICYYSEKSKVAFTGDTIFNVDIGRTDFEDGSPAQMERSILDKIQYLGQRYLHLSWSWRRLHHEKSAAVQYGISGRGKGGGPMSIRLIALDLDGTTLNSAKHISARTRHALEAAAKQGVHIVVATGRPFAALPKDVFEIEAIRYMLTSNGAAITDLKTREISTKICLSS